ncbi:MAG: hypothetical protein JOS17DRAFT_732269 [Linnemannia elongata]|nr:MAG: hypothetical protein JOS17DRAFT_732269 [Linnemannia elongata]
MLTTSFLDLKKVSPKPSPPGLFRLLLDNINRSDPGIFALPQEIRSYFRDVETKSDGGYADTADYKPYEPVTTHQSAWMDALELKDKKGEIRLCYHCGKSAIKERWLISCEHCPLHWHLDCLSPPLSSPPSRARKWMCPNHAFHVQPRYRKTRNASPIEVLYPLVPNDGDIEVADEKQGNNYYNNSQSPNAPEYRLFESNVRFDFIAACSRARNSSKPTPLRTEPVFVEGEEQFGALEMLAQTVILESSGKLDGTEKRGK